MSKLRVGLLFGGRSVEHEVSVSSASSIFRALDIQNRPWPATVTLRAAGETRSILALINEPPLGFMDKLGLDPAAVQGESEVVAEVAFPLIRALALEELSSTDWWRVMRREVGFGVTVGLLLAGIGFARVALGQQTYGPRWAVVGMVVGLSLICVVLALTWQHGVIAILIGQIVVAVLSYIPNAWFSRTLIDYSIREQCADFLPSLMLSSVIALCC